MQTAAEAYVGTTLQTATELRGLDNAGRPYLTRSRVPVADSPGTSGDDVLGGWFEQLVNYTRDGQVWKTIYSGVAGSNRPNDQTITSMFNAHGLLHSQTAWLEEVLYDPFGRPLQTVLGNNTSGLVLDTVYAESDGRLARLTARQRPLTASPTTDTYLQDDTYLHDPAGNPTTIVHNTTPTGTGWGDETECFAYDTRQRLTTALTLNGLVACPANLPSTGSGPNPYHETYTIDALTRITSLDGNTRSHGATSPGGCRTYTDPTKPHALTTSTGGGQSDTFTYDCNGALTTQVTTGGPDPGTTTYQYDPQQRLVYVSTPDGATVNTYDTTNNRVLRVDPDGTRTVYLGTTEIRYAPGVGVLNRPGIRGGS